VPETSGLEEIFEEISPIEDLGETMQLSSRTLPRAGEVLDRGVQGARQDLRRPAVRRGRVHEPPHGEIKTQTVFMGDFPLQTGKGTFIINGTERVVVSQLVRSPGVYFDKTPDKTSDKDIVSARVIPSRGAWLEFEIDKRDQVGVRIDRKRKQSVTVFLKALGLSSEDILAEFAGYESIADTLSKDTILTKEDALRDIYRKLRPGEQVAAEAARALLDNFYFNPKRYDLAKVGRYKINQKLGLDKPLSDSVLTVDDIVATIKYLVALHGRRAIPGIRNGKPPRSASTSTTSTTSATVASARSASSSRTRSARACPHGARRPRAHDHAGHRGDHAADPDQRPPRRRRDQGVLRHVAAVAVHGPEQPARGPDPQAPPLGARPRRSVA
jgi:DNA-directed RNA polymerase subunit beta